MAEFQGSIGLNVCYRLAIVETIALHQQYITPDLFMNGITKMQDFLAPEMLRHAGLPRDMIPQYCAEASQVLDLFQNFKIDPREIRHKLRELIGNGAFSRNGEEVVHRSDESRAAFERAVQISTNAETEVVAVQHLMSAILEIEGTRTRQLLEQKGINIKELLEAAAALPIASTPAPNVLTGFLGQFGIDLTQKAREGELSPVIGRKSEMMQVIRTLSREKKNNPVLIGEAGVGKTAIVEGLAQRFISGNIHPDFRDRRIIQIIASDLVADTKHRGDFESRMQSILTEVRDAKDVILFIDEIHLLISAGAAGGAMDAANILKPALARGEIRLIGATTDKDYRRYIEKDAALERRFQPIRVEEPSQKETYEILKGLREHLQEHHKVTIEEDAIQAAVQLSVRYMPNHRLPDKAYDLLDEACAWARYGSNISYDGNDDTSNIFVRQVTVDAIKEVVSEKIGVPVAQLKEDEANRIAKMADALRKRVVAQDEAIIAVANAVQRHYADLHEGKRPIGVFLFLGPTGVGKTELAKATANFLFGSDDRITRLNMSEFMEKHNVVRIIGAPPGYIGYEEGGQLTEALRRAPYSVILLDEIEKAHTDVLNIFLQVFGEGHLTDGQGCKVDASNAIFIMTSNLGYKPLSKTSETEQGDIKPQEIRFDQPAKDDILRAVYSHFRPEFLNRIDEMVIFKPLQESDVRNIVQIQLERLREILEQRQIQLNWTPEVVNWLAENGYDSNMGARPLIRLIDRELKNKIGGLVIERQIKPTHILEISLSGNELHINCSSPDTI